MGARMDENTDIGTFLVENWFMIPLVIISLVSYVRSSRRSRRVWKAAARRLNLTLPPVDHWSKSGETLVGVYQGRRVTLSEHDGDGSPRVIIEILLNEPLDLGLDIHRQGIMAEVMGLLGGQDITTGDTQFDDSFVVHGRDVERVRALVTPELRQSLMGMYHQIRQNGPWWRTPFTGGGPGISLKEVGVTDLMVSATYTGQAHSDSELVMALENVSLLMGVVEQAQSAVTTMTTGVERWTEPNGAG